MTSFKTSSTERESFTQQWQKYAKSFDFKKDDLDSAISFAWYLSNLDSAVFPNEPATVLIEGVNKNSKSTASYHSPAIDGREFYRIYVTGMADDLAQKRDKRRIFVKEDGHYRWPLKKEDPAHTNEQLNFGIALHEIRHRIQFHHRNQLKLFKSASQTNDELLSVVLRLVSEQFSKMPESLRAKGRDEQYIKRRTAPTEFDAQVIEDYAYNQPEEEIQNNVAKIGHQIAWLQPE